MAYDYHHGQSNQSGGISAHKQALGFDAAASEKLRIEQIQRERKRKEREDLKAKLQTEEKKLELNHTEMRQREIELRRLSAEKTRAESEIAGLSMSLQSLDSKLGEVKGKETEGAKHAEKLKLDLRDQKREYDKSVMDLQGLEQQLAELNRKIINQKREIHEKGMEVQRTTLALTQGGHQISSGSKDVFHIQSEKSYKDKERDNKSRLLTTLTDKMNHEASEIARLRGENVHLDTEIKSMKSRLMTLG